MGAALQLEPAPHRTPLWHTLRALGVTNVAFAAEMGVSVRTVCRWLNGTDRPHDPRAVQAVLAKLSSEPPVAVIHLHPPTTPTPPEPSEPPMEFTSREQLTEEEVAHFGLNEDPFLDGDDPDELFLPPGVKGVERAVKAAISRRQIIAVTADPGAGKSSLIRRIWAQLSREARIKLCSLASLDRTRVTSASIAVAVLRDLVSRDTSTMQNEDRGELLRKTLEDFDAQGMFPALFIDEAHHLPASALIAIKQLWDSHILFRQIGVVLVGQTKLQERLRTDVTLREVTGRTQIVTMPKMTKVAPDYLRWRFSRVGGDADKVFTPQAMEAIGVRGEYPLWINNISVLAMRAAKRVGETRVDITHCGR